MAWKKHQASNQEAMIIQSIIETICKIGQQINLIRIWSRINWIILVERIHLIKPTIQSQAWMLRSPNWIRLSMIHHIFQLTKVNKVVEIQSILWTRSSKKTKVQCSHMQSKLDKDTFQVKRKQIKTHSSSRATSPTLKTTIWWESQMAMVSKVILYPIMSRLTSQRFSAASSRTNPLRRTIYQLERRTHFCHKLVGARARIPLK